MRDFLSFFVLRFLCVGRVGVCRDTHWYLVSRGLLGRRAEPPSPADPSSSVRTAASAGTTSSRSTSVQRSSFEDAGAGRAQEAAGGPGGSRDIRFIRLSTMCAARRVDTRAVWSNPACISWLSLFGQAAAWAAGLPGAGACCCAARSASEPRSMFTPVAQCFSTVHRDSISNKAGHTARSGGSG